MYAVIGRVTIHPGHEEETLAMISGGGVAMVQGMVGRLAQRLAANPDDPAGWVQLVKAYAVLGDTEKRDAALKTARARYAGKPDVLADLAKAASTERMK